jgi:hypothetical protein
MGWISSRKQQTGTSLTSKRASPDKLAQPLRKILWVERRGEDLFARDLFALECGHYAYGNGQIRCRCRKCKQGLPPDFEPG